MVPNVILRRLVVSDQRLSFEDIGKDKNNKPLEGARMRMR